MAYRMVYLDGTNNREDSAQMLLSVWGKMVADNTCRVTLNDGTITSRDEFVSALLRPGSLPYIAIDDDRARIAACAWLNCIEGRMSRGHFVVFREYWGRKTSSQIMRFMLHSVLHYRDGDGYLFDTVLGITPASNPLAWKLILKSGGEYIGTIPHAVSHGETTEDGIMTATTRESLEKTE